MKEEAEEEDEEVREETVKSSWGTWGMCGGRARERMGPLGRLNYRGGLGEGRKEDGQEMMKKRKTEKERLKRRGMTSKTCISILLNGKFVNVCTPLYIYCT